MGKVFTYLKNTDFVTILLVVGLLFRLVLIPSPGFEADISFWKSWGLAVKDFGIVKGLPLTNFNYPTPFGYFLAVMAHVYSFFADPHNFNEYWNNSNILFLAIAKAPSILADFGIVALFAWIGKNTKRLGFPTLTPSVYLLFGLIYLFSPLSMFDGALWGQVDSVGVVLFMSAMMLAFLKKPTLAGIVYMISMMTKLQNMIYGPVFFLFIWQYMGYAGLIRALAGAGATFLGLNAEFIIARQMYRVIGDLTGNYDYFPWLSLNAYNIWWIVAKAQGMQISDKISSIGMVNAKSVGLYMFTSTYLLACLQMLRGKFITTSAIKAYDTLSDDSEMPGSPRATELIFRLFSALIIVCAGFFLFQTESHDRYAFPIAVFALLWAPFWITSLSKSAQTWQPMLERFLIAYGTFTMLYFYNVHNAMLANYPENGITMLSFTNVPWLTIVASVLQTAMFVAFLYMLRRQITTTLFAVCIGVFVLFIVMGNSSLILGKPVPITKFTPIISSTGYGQRMKNMPVNASFGIDKWGFLSVQYGFYRHGLGSHAPSREVFDINRQFRKLSTDFGIDTNGGPQGSAVFSVYGDGKELFTSPVKTRYEFPGHAEIDITGIKTLELIISDAGNGNFDDHADWLNTFLIP